MSRSVGVYLGRDRVGTVEGHGPKSLRAFDLAERSLGRFLTMREAMAAVPQVDTRKDEAGRRHDREGSRHG